MTDLRLGSVVMESAGSGPPIVMVHGLGGSSNSFETLMSVRESYSVYRPDLPGAGRSGSKSGIDINSLALSLLDMMQVAGLTKAHFVGHSMGTLVLQYLAASHPKIVESLVLFGPMLEPPVAARQGLRERAEDARINGMAGIAEAVSNASLFNKSKTSNPVTKAFVRESLMRQKPEFYALHCLALSEAKPAPVGDITCPTTLIVGQDDPVTPVTMAKQLHAEIRGSNLHILKDCGHWSMIETPIEAETILKNHLEKIAN